VRSERAALPATLREIQDGTGPLADCFRFRNKIGLDVALEALTDSWRNQRLKLDELNQIAKTLRIQRVMQPYLETVVM
jgi:hypothetical protein